MECTVPEYPGALAMGIEVPMDQGVAEVLRTVLESDGPVKFGPESEHPLPFNVARQFKYQSQISMAIHPKVGKSWMFGLHQCSHSRVWTEEEEKLLQEIGRRIADAMSSMLTLHNLRESQERYRALVDNTDLGIALISRDFEVLMSNPAQGRMLQKDHGDFIGGKCHFEFEKRDELCPHCPGRLAMESGHTHEAEAEGVRVDGTKISVRVQASPVYGEYGSVVGFVEIVEDITERKRAEQALSISELQYRTTIDSMGDAIHVVDANLRLVLFNDRFKQWTEELNIQVDNPIGRELLDVFSFLPDKVRDEYNQVFNGGKVLTTEEVVKIANREIITETRKIPIYEAGQVVRVVTVIRDITESKKAKEALQESEERFRGIYENALVGLYRTTPDGRILMANPAIVQMLGYSSFKELAKRSVEKVGFSSEYPRSVFKQRIETDGQVIGLESGWMKRDGTTLFVRESAKAIRDKEGKTLHYEGTVEDITERKRAEEALRESEEKFRSLAEQSPNVIFINQKGKIVYANKKCEEVTGYKRQELYSPDFNFLNLIAPESQDLIKKNFARHLKGREIPPYEYTLINKAGERIEAINTSRLIQYEGMPTIIGIVTDITERKRAERALREREETLMSIFRAAPIGIGLVSNRVLLQVNNKICEMLGYSSDELIGKNARILYLSDEDYEYVGREKYRQIRKYGTGTVETRWKCKDGRIIDIILSSTVFDSCDFSKGVTFTALDITDRKQAEQRLLEHRTQLKSLASELSLAEERERRRVAIELHDRIGQSLVISKMKLQTLRESLSTSEYADALKEVYNCLGQVIQDTRTLTFDLSYPILYEFGFKEAVSEWLEEQIRRKHGIETEFEDDGQPKLLDEDISVLLFRDVRELLINVVKHAEANKVKVSISRVDNDIQVCVEDNGVGFNADEIALLPTEAGGFGLFSIRERLEQIGGLIEIESKPGRGSRITMTAPIKYENIIDGAQK